MSGAEALFCTMDFFENRKFLLGLILLVFHVEENHLQTQPRSPPVSMNTPQLTDTFLHLSLSNIP